MAIVIRAIAPVAHFPLILGVLRKLNVAPLVDTLIPPHPEHVLSCGRGVEALVLALLDGHQALYKVGPRLDERGMFPLLPPGLTRHSVHDTRLGQILDALFAANLPRGFGAIARKALETYAIATPWIPQDTTTLALYGAYEAAAETEAPRPAYGHHTAGWPDLKQGLRSLGVRGDGGLPRRMALCDGTTSESVDVRQAIQARLALGLDGVQGSVADSKASSQRTLGLCVAQHVGLVPWVPRTGALRQEVDAWGQPQRSLPLLIDKPGRRRQDAPRRWYGRSLTRQGEGEDADGRGGLEPIRVVAVYSTPLAPQHAQAYITAQTQAAEALAQHPLQVEARRFACAADAEAAIAAYTGSGQGRRGRRPCPWRSHMGHSQGQTEWRRKKRARRGRPAKTDQPAEERCDRRGVETKPRSHRSTHTAGWVWRPRCVGPPVAMPSLGGCIVTRQRREHRAFAGSRPRQRSVRYGSKQRSGSRRWRC